jgi:hypothetical protein
MERSDNPKIPDIYKIEPKTNQNIKSMKKTVWIMIMLASSTVALAQKGSWYIGGVVGYNSSTSKDTNGNKSGTSSWAFAPEVGTFLRNDIQLGLALGLTGSATTSNGNDTNASSYVSPTLYSRKFFKITDNFSTFAGLYLTYISGKTTDYTPTTQESTQTGFGVRLGIGVAYALSPRFTAVGQYGLMGYQSLNNKNNGADAGTDSNFDFGVNTVGSGTLTQGNGSGAVFNIGIYYTFKPAP